MGARKDFWMVISIIMLFNTYARLWCKRRLDGAMEPGRWVVCVRPVGLAGRGQPQGAQSRAVCSHLGVNCILQNRV